MSGKAGEAKVSCNSSWAVAGCMACWRAATRVVRNGMTRQLGHLRTLRLVANYAVHGAWITFYYSLADAVSSSTWDGAARSIPSRGIVD